MQSPPERWKRLVQDLAGCCDPADAHLIAVSGGRDSMALWHLLRASGWSGLVAVHVEHRLRGAAGEADAALVEAEARRLGVPCEIRRVDAAAFANAGKCSLETAARELRYRAIAAVARERAVSRVLLAHHAGDQVETVLMRLFRGAGARGLAGMAGEAKRTIDGVELTLVRPFLEVSREEIDEYVGIHGVPFREDASNASDFALRNRIRNRLLPEIEAVFGREARAAILRASRLAALDEAWAAEMLGEAPRRGRGLDVAALRSFPQAKRNRTLLSWLRESGVPDCGLAEVERVAEVLRSEGRPAKANLPGGFHARRSAGELFIEAPA